MAENLEVVVSSRPIKKSVAPINGGAAFVLPGAVDEPACIRGSDVNGRGSYGEPCELVQGYLCWTPALVEEVISGRYLKIPVVCAPW